MNSPRWDGRPSHTDAMILADSCALAVEAKWTEPRYETVESRINRKGTDVNRNRELMEGWLELLQPYARRPLELGEFARVVYQMLHRAASACAMSRSPALAFLHFESMPPAGGATGEDYRADLSDLHRLLGNPQGLPFYLIELPIQPTAAFEAIEPFRKGTPETDRAVRAALLASRLFEFGEPRLEHIDARTLDSNRVPSLSAVTG